MSKRGLPPGRRARDARSMNPTPAVVSSPRPAVTDPGETAGATTRAGFVHRVVRVVPGLAAALAAAVVGVLLARVNGLLSPMLVAIVLGVVVANVARPAWLARVRPGLDLAGKKLLRVGIVLLGLQLSLSSVAALGWGVAALAVTVVVVGVPFGIWCGRRLGMSVEQSVLTACGFSICGAAAVAACDGVTDADEEAVATSVALVVVFGTLMIPVCVLVARLGVDERTVGVFAGASIHEVAQVVAAGGLVGGGALAVAVVVKLARVLMLAPVMTALAARRRRELARTQSAGDITLPPVMPLFVVGFVAAVAVRSVAHLPSDVLGGARSLQTALLAAAMFALGTGVRWQNMRKVGAAPFVHASACTLVVAALALGGALLVG